MLCRASGSVKLVYVASIFGIDCFMHRRVRRWKLDEDPALSADSTIILHSPRNSLRSRNHTVSCNTSGIKPYRDSFMVDFLIFLDRFVG